MNPKHLYVGGAKENMRDMCDRGRGSQSKLTRPDVEEIKRQLTEGVVRQRDIAKYFGVTEQLVYQIKVGKAWSWTDEREAQ